MGRSQKILTFLRLLIGCCLGLQEAAAADESDEEDEFIYNPLKLPLGWDGKPIPYWLYKLHGLNLEFKCEICGELAAAREMFGCREWSGQVGGSPENSPKQYHEYIKPDVCTMHV